MRFSVLIPTLNRRELARRAIETILCQEFDDFEIIVSDNASSEDYSTMVAALDDPRIRLLRQKGTVPVTENWNHALAHACGEYVIMLGDDDALAPNSLLHLNELISNYEQPDVVYSMAYHYAYPNVVPNSPGGYFATVKPRPIFSDQIEPSFLVTSQARYFAAQALKFRHLFGFNSQFFVWRRSFIESLSGVGPFFQSPYPDFYSSFVTMFKASRIVVDPEPRVIIGISPKSFGFFFHNNQIQAGNKMLGLAASDADRVKGVVLGAAEALDLPGSPHYRNWLIAAFYVLQNFAGEPGLAVDLRRFRRLQIFEAAFQFAYHDGQNSQTFQTRLTPTEGKLFSRLSWTFALMRRSKQIPAHQVHDSLFALFRIYPDAAITFHDLGPHETILDAFRWLATGGGVAAANANRRLLPKRLANTARSVWLTMTAGAARSEAVEELRRKTAALEEVVAELSLENGLLKKGATGDGENGD